MYKKNTSPPLYNGTVSLPYSPQYWCRCSRFPYFGDKVITRDLYFHNMTNYTLWIVYADYTSGCEGRNEWKKHGWYKVEPGEKRKVTMDVLNLDFLGLPVSEHEFLYYAEDNIGNRWSGEFFTQIPRNAFDWCWNTGSTNSTILGLRKRTISRSNEAYTLPFQIRK